MQNINSGHLRTACGSLLLFFPILALQSEKVNIFYLYRTEKCLPFTEIRKYKITITLRYFSYRCSINRNNRKAVIAHTLVFSKYFLVPTPPKV